MKIALFHNSYQTRGGEDSVFEIEATALRDYGHEVVTYHVNNASVLAGGNITAKIKTAWQAPHNKASQHAITEFLKQERPDISHVHNWFPLLSPSIYTAHQAAGVGVVQTLHNYRLGCAAATFRRNGTDCTQCLTGSNCNAVKNRCYNNSLAGSIAWKRIMDRNWNNGTFTKGVDHYICPSREIYERHRQLGLPEERMSIVPNACPDARTLHITPQDHSKLQVCFVGRLVPEKGAHVLIKAWLQLNTLTRAKCQLNIIGEGPEAQRLQAMAQEDPSIVFQGVLTHRNTLKKLCASHLLICPSLWAEPFGLTVIEAMSAGIAVIASELGGPAEIVIPNQTGRLFPADNHTALHAMMQAMLNAPQELKHMGQAGRQRYLNDYTQAAHATELTNCFHSVIETRLSQASRTQPHSPVWSPLPQLLNANGLNGQTSELR